jgi:hypothetical protein
VLREKFQRDPYTLNDIRQKLTALCNVVSPSEALSIVKEDPDCVFQRCRSLIPI